MEPREDRITVLMDRMQRSARDEIDPAWLAGARERLVQAVSSWRAGMADERWFALHPRLDYRIRPYRASDGVPSSRRGDRFTIVKRDNREKLVGWSADRLLGLGKPVTLPTNPRDQDDFGYAAFIGVVTLRKSARRGVSE